jgi:uncharacterized protein YukE
MATFSVQTPALAAAALRISGTASTAETATTAADSLANYAGAFEGEPIGAAWLQMSDRASTAVAHLVTILDSLSRNVAAASAGYLVTDQGVVPFKDLFGTKA